MMIMMMVVAECHSFAALPRHTATAPSHFTVSSGLLIIIWTFSQLLQVDFLHRLTRFFLVYKSFKQLVELQQRAYFGAICDWLLR